MPVIGREEIDLEVLPGLVADAFPVNDHAQGQRCQDQAADWA